MANEEQLSILKQGVEVWNEWRDETFGIAVDLTGANLIGADLHGAFFGLGVDLTAANLTRADLREAYLGRAHLRGADLRSADLSGANLTNANLSDANLTMADLSSANLDTAFLAGANFAGAFLNRATLVHTSLNAVNLNEANLIDSDFSWARVARTVFGGSDLSETIGLEDVIHYGPSTIGIDTIYQSKGKIPEIFLRGCGLSDVDLEYAKLLDPDLSNEEINKTLYNIYDLRATRALQIFPLFISYSRADGPFVDKIEAHLDRRGIRYWRDIHDMKAGKLEKQIDRAISQNRTVLVILSKNSTKSDWVEHEVRMARELEKEIGHDVLCPVALDDSWKSSPWSKRVMQQIMEYNILDFSEWKDDSKFEDMFRKLIDGLELFYKG